MAQICRLIIAVIIQLLCLSDNASSAERFFISIPGPGLSYAHLYYGQERGFFSWCAV